MHLLPLCVVISTASATKWESFSSLCMQKYSFAIPRLATSLVLWKPALVLVFTLNYTFTLLLLRLYYYPLRNRRPTGHIWNISHRISLLHLFLQLSIYLPPPVSLQFRKVPNDTLRAFAVSPPKPTQQIHIGIIGSVYMSSYMCAFILVFMKVCRWSVYPWKTHLFREEPFRGLSRSIRTWDKVFYQKTYRRVFGRK